MEVRSMVVYEALRLVYGPIISLLLRLRVEGAENVPEAGGALVVGNHRSYLDPLVLAQSIPRYINFGAGSHLYQVPGTAPLMKLAGFFPVNIYGGRGGDTSMDEASRLLQSGELVGLFPEGIESFMYVYRVSKISQFKTGFAKIAIENRVPVVPAAIVPEEEKELMKIPGFLVAPFVKHPHAKEGVDLITYRKVTCRIGRAIDLSPFFDEPLTKNVIDQVAAKVRRIITRLYDGEDLDKYLTGETPFDFANDRV